MSAPITIGERRSLYERMLPASGVIAIMTLPLAFRAQIAFLTPTCIINDDEVVLGFTAMAFGFFSLVLLLAVPAGWKPQWRRIALATHAGIALFPFVAGPVFPVWKERNYNPVYQQLEDGSWRRL